MFQRIQFISLILFSSFGIDSLAQFEWRKIEGNAGIGISLFERVYVFRDSEFPEANIHNWSKPAWCGALSYRISPYLSVGLAGGVQSIGQDLRNINVTIDETEQHYELLNYRVTRSNLGVRLLAHLPSENTSWDFYSGVKFGWSLFSFKIEQTDSDLANFIEDELKFGLSAPSLQFIPFGVRYYGLRYVGVYAETAIGAPAYLSIGISWRLMTPNAGL